MVAISDRIDVPKQPGGGLLTAVSLGLAVGYICSLVAAYASHAWLLDTKGKPVVFDFVAFWAAGRMVLQGHALTAYNPQLQHAAEVATVGHDFNSILGWSYPPAFLFVAGALALLPFVPAFLVWIATTVGLYASVVAAIARKRAALLLALAPPWVLLVALAGQNGFLTAALVGGVLLTLEKKPVLSGILLGLLSIKPQFGLLFPVVLVAGNYWRTFAWATATVLALTAVSSLAFGSAGTMDFIHGLSTAAQSHLSNGGLAPNNMQSVFGLTRWAGVPQSAALLLQLATTLSLAFVVHSLWRSNDDFSLKAAGTVPAILLATPYVLAGDLAMLTVALAFLFRNRPFDQAETWVTGIALVLVAGFLLHPYPAGFFADIAVGALVWRRRMRVGTRGVLQTQEAGPTPLTSRPG